MPSDPFEVDLLTMAEAVINAHSEVPDCIIEPDEVKRMFRKIQSFVSVCTSVVVNTFH